MIKKLSPIQKEVSPSLKAAIESVWQSIAGDMEFADGEDENEVAMETVIDANRLSTNGFPEAEAEVTALIQKHGYTEVMWALCNLIHLV